MNIVKTRNGNKIKDDFLIDYLILYIEREIATKFIIESIMYNFWDSKELKCVCVYLYILDNSMVLTLGECEI